MALRVLTKEFSRFRQPFLFFTSSVYQDTTCSKNDDLFPPIPGLKKGVENNIF